MITKRLDTLPFSSWHFLMVLAIGTIWIFDGYEVSLVSLFSTFILRDHSHQQYQALAISYQLGCIIGSIAFSLTAFYLGRKAIFMATLAVYALGVLLCLFNSSINLFILGRFLTGTAVGGEFTAIFTAVDEFLPSKIRGRVNIIVDGTWHLGGILGATLNFAVGDVENWRMFFGLGLLGVLAIGCIRKSIPESPRWLIMKGRIEEAQQIIIEIERKVLDQNRPGLDEDPEEINEKNYDKEPIDPPCSPMDLRKNRSDEELSQHEKKKDGDKLSEKQSHQPVKSEYNHPNKVETSSLREQLRKIAKLYKKRLFLSSFLIVAEAFFFNLLYYEFPILLQHKYGLTQKSISKYMIFLSLSSFLSTLLVGPLFDKVGRRLMLLITCNVFVIVDSGAGLILLFSQLYAVTAVQLLILTCIMFIFGSPASSAANLIASEIFPTSTRPIVLSFIFILGMAGGIVGLWINSYLITALVMVVAGIVGMILCPACEGKALQQMDIKQ